MPKAIALPPGWRLFLALVMIFSPMAAPVFVESYGLSNARLNTLPLIGAIVFGSLVLALVPAIIVEPNGAETVDRWMKILFGNLFFVLFDLAIFAVLVYGRHLPGHECQYDVCETYPVMWLALAGMHLCYVVLACFARVRWC